MIRINRFLLNTCLLTVALFAGLSLAGCNEGKSYSDLLDEEEKAVNWYLAQQRVVASVPEDSVFETGPNAPFYRMNSDGSVYMRVISMGDMSNRPKKGDTVYLRYLAQNIKYLFAGTTSGTGTGNADNMLTGGNQSLVYGNTYLSSTTSLGTGIQVPLGYLGYNCEVDLIVKSIEGRAGDISNCIPYLYSGLKYFKAEY